MVSELAFSCLVVVVALQRLLELRLSRQNEARLRARGGREHAPHQLRWMTWLHGAWLLAMPLEVLVAERPFLLGLAVPMLVVFLCGQGLRYAAIRGLADRWCVRIITLPGEGVVSSGIFSKLRHPNYLGVVLEIAALPLVHSAWVTALLASLLNTIVLRARIRAEESALASDSNYRETFGQRARTGNLLTHFRAWRS